MCCPQGFHAPLGVCGGQGGDDLPRGSVQEEGRDHGEWQIGSEAEIMEISTLSSSRSPAHCLETDFEPAVHGVGTRKEPAVSASQKSSVWSPEAKALGICDTVE